MTKYSLYYLARPNYGGWVTFTAHMALKYDMPLYRVGNRTEVKADGSKWMRDYGYGAKYQNIAAKDVKNTGPKILITAIDKNFYSALPSFPDGTYIVIHDPTEVAKQKLDVLLPHLKRFRIVTIRASVQEYLKKLGLRSKFIIHPFYEYDFKKAASPTKTVSISRIDYDKHTDILLDANKHLPVGKKIEIYGALNRMYAFHKLQGTDFKKYYKGGFEKSFEELNEVLKDAKFVADMSVIKFDGGGTQYTFLEAIYQGCALIINKAWVEGFKSVFKPGSNCFAVADGKELADLLKENPATQTVMKNAKKILTPHLAVDWAKEMNSWRP
jgi:glycosyltransferase involved in cell wall biosynthesis